MTFNMRDNFGDQTADVNIAIETDVGTLMTLTINTDIGPDIDLATDDVAQIEQFFRDVDAARQAFEGQRS